jgi:demethylmenaquinone methyltransferase/2-methoxy-6-polyprenyl-1,4-benzoquinol methylase
MSQPVRSLFNQIAPTYDFLNHLFSFNLDRRWRIIASRKLKIFPDAVILDVCTGTADLALSIAEKHPFSRIYGIDFSENMLKRGQSKIAKRPDRRIHLSRANALHLPFRDRTFDCITIAFGLRNLIDRRHSLQEMQRVLKEPGQCVILEFAPPPKSLFGAVYRFYLSHIIPVIGQRISQSTSAYQYLGTSIEHFLEPEEIVTLLKEIGFQAISRQRLMFGIVWLYTALWGRLVI